MRYDEYRGPLIPYYFLIIYNIPLTIRSLIHILFRDGGAQSIAGMPLNNDISSQNLIALMAQWGSSQLVLSYIIWWVVLYYNNFTHIMLSACFLELFLRYLSSRLKKFSTIGTPPGATGTYIALPILLFMTVWAILAATEV